MARAAPRVAIVGNETILVEGLRQVLRDHGLTAAACTDDPRSLAEAPGDADGPDLVLLLDFPERGSALREGVERLRERFPEARLVLLLPQVAPAQLSAALELDVRGLLLRSSSREALVYALHLVLLGETVLPTRLAAELMETAEPRAAALAGRAPEDLSPRDVEILRCLVLGLPNKAIAQQFKLSEATIKVHVRHLLRKIGAENRTQAAVWAIARGLAARPSGSPAAGDSSSETRPSETKTVRRHLMPVPVVAPR